MRQTTQSSFLCLTGKFTLCDLFFSSSRWSLLKGTLKHFASRDNCVLPPTWSCEGEEQPWMLYGDFFFQTWESWPNTFIVVIIKCLVWKDMAGQRVAVALIAGKAENQGILVIVSSSVWALKSQLQLLSTSKLLCWNALFQEALFGLVFLCLQSCV